MNNIISLVTPLLISLSVLLVPIGIGFGTLYAVNASNEQDKIKKNKLIWHSVICFFGPIVTIFLLVSLWGLLNILTSTFSN